MLKTVRLVSLALMTLGTSAFSQEATCTIKTCNGKAPNDHNHGSIHFLTTSQVYKSGIDEMYETCVQNLGSVDIEVNWVIPGPETVVPIGCAIPSYRPQDKRDTIDTYRSCLRYGASWSWDRSPFFPHASEQQQISEETGKDCRELSLASISEDESYPRQTSIFMERFAASVPEDFERTLSKIALNIDVSVFPDDGVYTTSLKISFAPAYVDQPEYYSKGFRVSPSKSAIEQGVFANVQPSEIGGFFESKDALIEYTMPIPKSPARSAVRYVIMTRSAQRVASFDVPIWVEKTSP